MSPSAYPDDRFFLRFAFCSNFLARCNRCRFRRCRWRCFSKSLKNFLRIRFRIRRLFWTITWYWNEIICIKCQHRHVSINSLKVCVFYYEIRRTLPCGCHSICVSLGRFGSFVPQLLASCFLVWFFRRFLRLLKLYLLLSILLSTLALFLMLISLSMLFCCWFCYSSKLQTNNNKKTLSFISNWVNHLLLQPIAERLCVDDVQHRSLDGASMVRYNNRLVWFAPFRSDLHFLKKLKINIEFINGINS